ncbi:MAG: AfsR/SARP family transcriptional regulator [Candidatus Dormibacteraceae bacterium]
MLNPPRDRVQIGLVMGWGALAAQALAVGSNHLAVALAALALIGVATASAWALQTGLWAALALVCLGLRGGPGPLPVIESALAAAMAALAIVGHVRSLNAGGRAELGGGAVGGASGLVAQGSTTLAIATLGGLKITRGEEDLTPGLLRKPTLAFIWLYLLLRALQEPGRALRRDALADEVSPGLARSEQMRRLTSQLWDLQHDLEPGLVDPLLIGRDQVRFDLERVHLDADALVKLGRRVAEAGRPGVAALVEEIEAALASDGFGEFLPEADQVLERVAGSRGGSDELLRAVRERVHQARTDVVSALADHFVAAGQPLKAVRWLEPGLVWDSSGSQLASRLVRALLESGQVARAAALGSGGEVTVQVSR